MSKFNKTKFKGEHRRKLLLLEQIGTNLKNKKNKIMFRQYLRLFLQNTILIMDENFST